MRHVLRASTVVLATCIATEFSLAQTSVQLSVEAKHPAHRIDPNIYGIANGVDPAFAQEIQLPSVRWGGDATTRYNWQVDSSNAGKDWYFMGGSGHASPMPSGQVDQMINSYRPAGTLPLITIPIIPYINKTSETTCSYRVDVYGPQQSVNPYVTLPGGIQCGNGIAPNGNQILDTNIYYNHVDNIPGIQADWATHLVNTFGKETVRFFQLDNEPYGWGNTHVDVEPNGATYDEIIELGQKYASAIKSVEPDAQVLGPSDFTLGGWIGDTTRQNGLYAGQYYLQQMRAYQNETGTRLIDYFDEHFYGGGTDQTSELASTRALWDPTFNSGTWVEQYVFQAPMDLIPRFKSWIKEYYPGTKLAISEYGFGFDGTLVGALTEADVLGIFGREGLELANLFTVPDPVKDPVAYSFRLFRNYDGQGGQFGDLSLRSTSSDQGQLSIYGAYRSSDKAITLVVINKTINNLTSSVSLSGLSHPATSADVYSYSNANLTAIMRQPNVALESTGKKQWTFAGSFPALSASIIVISSGE